MKHHWSYHETQPARMVISWSVRSNMPFYCRVSTWSWFFVFIRKINLYNHYKLVVFGKKHYKFRIIWLITSTSWSVPWNEIKKPSKVIFLYDVLIFDFGLQFYILLRLLHWDMLNVFHDFLNNCTYCFINGKENIPQLKNRRTHKSI